MLQFLLLLALGLTPSKAQSEKDSLTIYNAYKNSIEMLKDITDPEQWYRIEDSIDRATACAFRRLGLYNKGAYEPTTEFNREGFGEAFDYPQPDAPQRIAFSITDRQTKFMSGDNGNTLTPYCERLYFNQAMGLIKTERLNPMTLLPIISPDPKLISTLMAFVAIK